MGWFDAHPDRTLSRLSAGLASPQAQARARGHARTCARCEARYEAAVRTWRALETGSPFVPVEAESLALAEGGLAALLRAAPAEKAPGFAAPWGAWLGAAAVAAAVVGLVWARPWRGPDEDEFTARGGPEVGRSVLRVFCAADGAALRELHRNEACPAGAHLALAAGSDEGRRTVIVRLRSRAGEQWSEPLAVAGTPGQVAPLSFTPVLAAVGEAEVVAGFGADAAEASQAAQGTGAGERRLLRLRVGVAP
jgi:hypothetical protein